MSVERLNSTDSRVEVFKKLNEAIERTDDATPENVGTLRVASNSDEKNCSCNNAALTPSNLYDLINLRKANTGYAVGDTVGCAYHNDLQLKCIFAGITENSGLDTSGELKKGQTIQDGTVVWTVEEIGTGSGSGHSLFDIVQKDHVLSYDESEGFEQLGTYVYKEAIAGSRYGYPTFYEQCLKEYQEAVADGIYFKHANGHVFYDIANKAEVDAVYNSTGIAWAYGIDTANERIFLPRNDYLTSYVNNGETPVAYDMSTTNNMQMRIPLQDSLGRLNMLFNGVSSSDNTEGLTGANVSTNYGQVKYTGTGYSTSDTPSGGTTGTVTPSKVNLDPNGTLYVNISNVQDANQYAYMVVGNTANEEALTDIIDITTTENDTLPLFYNTYSQQDMTSTGAFVNASLGNYLDGSVWTTAYSEIEKMGIGAKFGAGTIKAYGDSSITDFDLVLNQSNMTFRLPLLNGTEGQFLKGNYPVVGNGMTLGLTDGTNNAGLLWGNNSYPFVKTSLYGTAVGTSDTGSNSSPNKTLGVTTDASKSGLIAKINATVPQGWNLYYKLNNVVQNEQILDVAGVTSALNKKVSVDNLVEAHVVVETYQNGASWYRVWSDGWCEQGGQKPAKTTTITFLKPFINAEYYWNVYGNKTAAVSSSYSYYSAKTNTDITTLQGTEVGYWYACGYIS